MSDNRVSVNEKVLDEVALGAAKWRVVSDAAPWMSPYDVVTALSAMAKLIDAGVIEIPKRRKGE